MLTKYIQKQHRDSCLTLRQKAIENIVSCSFTEQLTLLAYFLQWLRILNKSSVKKTVNNESIIVNEKTDVETYSSLGFSCTFSVIQTKLRSTIRTMSNIFVYNRRTYAILLNENPMLITKRTFNLIMMMVSTLQTSTQYPQLILIQ